MPGARNSTAEPNDPQDEEEQVDDVHVEDEGSEDVVLGAEWVLVFAADHQLRVDHDEEAENNARSSQLRIKKNSHGHDREMHLDYQSCMTGDSPEDDAADAGVEEVESPAASEDGGDQSEDEETDQGGDQTTLIKIQSFKTDPRS